MRQGPLYRMPIPTFEREPLTIPVPLELVEDFSEVSTAIWKDNGDGTYTITLIKDE